MKYLGINSVKYVQDIYVDKKISLRKVREHVNKWNAAPCSWIRKHNIVKR